MVLLPRQKLSIRPNITWKLREALSVKFHTQATVLFKFYPLLAAHKTNKSWPQMQHLCYALRNNMVMLHVKLIRDQKL